MRGFTLYESYTVYGGRVFFATLNLHVQALKLYIYYYIDIYLKDVIYAPSCDLQK